MRRFFAIAVILAALFLFVMGGIVCGVAVVNHYGGVHGDFKLRVGREKPGPAQAPAPPKNGGRKIPFATQQKVAIHEAGHAVAAAVLFSPWNVERIVVNLELDELSQFGFVERERCNTVRTFSEMRDDVVILLAGRAAEEAFFKEASDGAVQDLTVSQTLVVEAYCKDGLGMTLIVEGEACTLASVGRPVVDSEFIEAYIRAQVIVHENRKLVLAVANALVRIKETKKQRMMPAIKFRDMVRERPIVVPSGEHTREFSFCSDKWLPMFDPQQTP